MKRNLYRVLSTLFVFLVIAGPCTAQMIYDIDRPENRRFITDLADLINAEDTDHIRTKADQLLTDTVTPIIVVTIDRMSDHVNKSLRIETFAHFLFDQWEIGHVQIEGANPEDLNKGVLLLVSKGDRKARIQLGAGWGRGMDRHCQRIMDGVIIPAFKSGNFSAGIVQGFDSLEDMVRNGIGKGGSQSPKYKKEKTTGDYLFIAALIGFGVFTVISLARSGSNGSAWIIWAAIFGILFFILKAMAAGGGGGGGGGGSYGGGYSGGGGASGSW